MKKILICGDSFAADWTVKYPVTGWPNLLANQYEVINVAQAGCSEYRIRLQLSTVDLSIFDRVIIAHTSPYRLYVADNPIHKNDVLHGNSDFIYSDISNYELDIVKHYFEKFYDLSYARYIHSLVYKDIEDMVGEKAIHISLFDYGDIPNVNNVVSFSDLFERHRGLANHLDEYANQIVYDELVKEIEKTS